MANICTKCGKGTVYGHSQKHHRGVAGKRWKNRVTASPRLFKPNLQMITILKDGKRVQVKYCTKCIKRLKKDKELSSQVATV